jgi:hypothetical protein
MLEQRFHHLREPRLDAGRACNDEGLGPARELGIEQEEGQAGEMIAVEMRNQDQLDVVALDLEPLHCRQRRGAAVDQQIGALSGEMKAGVVAAARAERVTAADEPQLHRPRLALSAARREQARQ